MNIVLWGAGTGGTMALSALLPEINVVAIVDIDPSKIGGSLDGIPIIHPSKLKNYDFDYCAITNIHGFEVREMLIKECGVTYNKILDVYNSGLFDHRIGILKKIKDEINFRNLDGDIAEVGVYKGDFAKYLNLFFENKILYLYDTFEGFDSHDIKFEQSLDNGSSEAQSKIFSDGSAEIVLKKMVHPENCVIRKGYFPDTALQESERSFCFVSLDADLYNPIYAGLEFFYPRLVKGGYILVHDYNNPAYSGAKEAVRAFSQKSGVGYCPVFDLNGSVVIYK